MLINNIAELKACLGGVQKTMNWGTWQPFVEQAEISYIKPAIGAEFYNEIAEYDGDDELVKSAKKYFVLATAYFAYWIGLPQLTTAMGDAGVSTANPSQAQPMAKWSYVNLQRQLLNKAERHLEEGLVFLETNQDLFGTWVNSSAYTISRSLLIWGATHLTEFFPHANNSRRLYLIQRNYLLKSEDFWLTQTTGEELLNSWREKLVNNQQLSMEERYAIRLARFAVAYNSFEDSVNFLNISEDWRLISETDGILNEDVLPAERRNEIAIKCQKDAEMFLGKLKDYLNKKASESIFPEYFESDHYQPPKAKPKQFENDPCKKYFRL